MDEEILFEKTNCGSGRSSYGRHRERLFIQQESKCYWCHSVCEWNSGPLPQFTVDHILPLGHGGTNHWMNLVGACRRCNTERDERWREIKFILIAPPEPKIEPARYSFADKLAGIVINNGGIR